MEKLKSKGFILFAAAVLLIAGVAAAVEFARPTKAENPRLERLLPADTVGFVEVNDLRAQALKVIESEAWREFSKENSEASSLFMIGANHAGTLDASYALALLGFAPNAEGKPEPQFVVVGQFNDWGARYTFENRVLRFVKDGQSKGVEAKTEEVDGARVVTVRRGGVARFTYAAKDTLLVVSNTDAAVRRVLDVRAQRAPSLETSEKFRQARAGSGAVDGMFGYLDGEALTRIVDGAAVLAGDEKVAAFRQLFHGLGAASVRSASFTSAFEDGRVVERFGVVAPVREGVLATVASNPPTEGRLLALVPEGAVQAFDASVANAPQTFDQMFALASQLSNQAGKRGPEEGLAQFTEKTGVDLRAEIVGAVGTEVCVAQLTAVGSEEGPSGVVIVNVRDEAAFAGALAKFAEKHGRATAERVYKGVKVSRVAGEKEGRGLEYAFVGGNFVASGRPENVERVIDTAQGGPSLRESAAYRGAAAQLQGPAQFVYFNTNADYLDRLGRTLSGGEQTFKTEGQRAALRPSFAFGVMRADGFYVESRTPLGTFPRLLTAVTSKLGGEKKDGGAE